MEKKKRKPLTAEQRAKKNAADRARRIAKKPTAKTKPVSTKPPLPKVKKVRGRPHGKPALPKGMRSLSKRSGKFVRPVKIKQHGITRPSPTDGEGKPRKTFMVWDIADKISARTRKPATRAAVKVECSKLKTPGGKRLLSYSTFSNSFYAWRQFNGIQLRRKKDGTLSKPMGPGHGPTVKGKKAKLAPKKKASRKPPLPVHVAKHPTVKQHIASKKKKPAKKKPALPVATTIAPAPAVIPAPLTTLPIAAPDIAPPPAPVPVAAKPALPGKPPLPEVPVAAVPAFMAPPPL